MKSISYSSGKILTMERPLIMGIINCTPDSFAVRSTSTDEAVAMARQMVEEGADILDIGGESSRPGSDPVPSDTELERVIPVIRQIRVFSEIPISVDTTKAIVAEKALTAGADIVNDISALAFDSKMAETVSHAACPVVLMHIKGMPKTMQENPHYDDILAEVSEYFSERIKYAYSYGISEDKIILDVGIGFGKRTVDNLMLLKHLGQFTNLGKPLLVGVSRKRFIGDLTGMPVENRITASAAAAALAVANGADLIRTHDVAATKQAVAIATAVREV